MWSKCIHSWGIGPCLLGFNSFVPLILKLWIERRTLSKVIFKTQYLANLLCIVWYDYTKMYEWLLSVEYDVYHNVLYFLLYLNCEKLYEVVMMLVDNCDNNHVNNDNVVMTLIWIVTCWLYGRKYLIMQLLLKFINVNGGDLLHCCCWIYMRWFCIVESLLVCQCIIVILSHMCCKRVVNFYFVEM